MSPYRVVHELTLRMFSCTISFEEIVMIVRTFSTKFSGFYLLFETTIPQSRNAGSHSIHRETVGEHVNVDCISILNLRR